MSVIKMEETSKIKSNISKKMESVKEEPQIRINSIFWLEILLAFINIVFLVWSFSFNHLLFTIEITLPIGIFILFPSLVISFVFLIHAYERSNIIKIDIDNKYNSDEANDTNNSQILLKIGKLKLREYRFSSNDLQKIELKRKKLNAGSGLLIVFHIFFGLGYLYYSYELINVSAYQQSIIFLTYGTFAIISCILWMFVYSFTLEMSFSGDRNNVIPIFTLIQRKKLHKKLVDLFSSDNLILGELDRNYNINRLDFYGVILVFVISFFTFIYNYQLTDTVSAVLILLYIHRWYILKTRKNDLLLIKDNVKNKSKSDNCLDLEYNVKNNELNSNSRCKNAINKLGQSLKYKNISGEEFLIWLYLLNELGWKFWYNLTLIIIDPGLLTIMFFFAAFAYLILLLSFYYRIEKSEIVSDKTEMDKAGSDKTEKEIYFKTIIVLFIILPISGILTALRLISFAITIFGIPSPV